MLNAIAKSITTSETLWNLIISKDMIFVPNMLLSSFIYAIDHSEELILQHSLEKVIIFHNFTLHLHLIFKWLRVPNYDSMDAMPIAMKEVEHFLNCSIVVLIDLFSTKPNPEAVFIWW